MKKSIGIFGKASNDWGLEGLIKKVLDRERLEKLALFGLEQFDIEAREKLNRISLLPVEEFNFELSLGDLEQRFDSLVFIQGRFIDRTKLRLFSGKKVLWNAEFLPYFTKETDPEALARLTLIEPLDDFDLILNGCPLSADFFRKTRNLNMIAFPMMGVVEGFHRPIDGVVKDIDVGFYGAPSPKRKEAWFFLHNEVRKRKLDTQWIWASCFGEELIKFINRCKIVLNIHYGSLLNTESRLYEVLGCKAFCMSETISNPAMFRQDFHLVYNSISALPDKIVYWLDNGDKREELATNGYRYVHSCYSMEKVLYLLVSQIEAL